MACTSDVKYRAVRDRFIHLLLIEIFQTSLTPIIFLYMAVGVLAGICIGALPGLTATIGLRCCCLWVMLIAGIVGYFMSKLKIPTSPAILGLIFGPMAEKNFRTALLKSGGNPLVFLILLSAGFLLY